jgi:hypothetical protein
MNLIQIFYKIYQDLFSWAFDDEFDLDRTFNGLNKFHREALPESENQFQSTYAKVFKNDWFYLISPIIYLYMKFLAMKYSNTEYLQRLIEKSIDDEN